MLIDDYGDIIRRYKQDWHHKLPFLQAIEQKLAEAVCFVPAQVD
jgi:hypothetical protein